MKLLLIVHMIGGSKCHPNTIRTKVVEEAIPVRDREFARIYPGRILPK